MKFKRLPPGAYVNPDPEATREDTEHALGCALYINVDNVNYALEHPDGNIYVSMVGGEELNLIGPNASFRDHGFGAWDPSHVSRLSYGTVEE